MGRSLALVVLLAACGGANTPAATSGGRALAPVCDGTVTLQLAWPATLEAHVAGRMTTEEAGVTYPSGSLPSDTTMRVTADGSGRRLHFTARDVGMSSAHGLMPSMQGVFPDVLFAPDGAVRAVEGGGAMRMALSSHAARNHDDPQQVRLMMEAIGDDWLASHQRTYWELVARIWAGRTLACGTPVSTHEGGTEVNFGHVDSDVRSDLLWLGWVPCPPRPGRGGETRCAMLRVTQTMTLPHVAGLDGTMTPRRVDVTRVGELIVEPETLVPRAIRFLEDMHLDQASAPQAHGTETYVFSYVAPSNTDGHAAILAMQMPNGHLFFWPADPATGGPLRLPDTADCRQLHACCESLANMESGSAMMCAAMVQGMQGSDCDSALGMTDLTLALSQVPLPAACTLPGAAPETARPPLPTGHT